MPANLRATTTGNSITWSWDAVEGAIGYNYQFGPTTATFTDDTPTVQHLTATSYTASGLAGNTAYHFRVRTVAGTLQEQVVGDWSAAVSETAGAAPTPPAPTTTPLSAPGNVRTPTRRDTAITVAWDSVTDAEAYEVQQQAAGAGSWSSANCGNAGNQVTATECVASGLESGTEYGFRVRAVPDSADTDLAPSPWSSAVSTSTTGRATVDVEPGGLNLRWKSEFDLTEVEASGAGNVPARDHLELGSRGRPCSPTPD